MSQQRDEWDVAEAIQNLYRTFERYPLACGFVERCSPTGDRRKVAKRLTERPLDRADPEDLSDYAFKALSTMGEDRDFKHFLPRMLECFATIPEWMAFGEDVFRKLDELRWQDWPSQEKTAIDDYLEILWAKILEDESLRLSPAVFLDAVSKGVGSLDSFLKSWEDRLPAKVAAVRLAKAVQNFSFERSALKTWLHRPSIKAKLESAFFLYTDEETASELSNAVDILSWAR